MGWSRRVRSCLEAPLELLRPVPPMAWIPISILWFGIGNKAAAFIIFLGAFFPVLLNTMAGVKSIDPVILDAARTLNAARRTVFFKILIPATVPSIFTGVRIGLGIGWMTLVAAEFTGVREGYGLGYMIMTARDIQRPDLIVAGMCVIGFVGIILDKGLRVVRDRCAAWQ
ncbi:ABC transporter permease [Geomonas subterranea]|nr:ABC transporter permease [Geomonas subterranea]